LGSLKVRARIIRLEARAFEYKLSVRISLTFPDLTVILELLALPCASDLRNLLRRLLLPQLLEFNLQFLNLDVLTWHKQENDCEGCNPDSVEHEGVLPGVVDHYSIRDYKAEDDPQLGT